jgi:hypothetical protein
MLMALEGLQHGDSVSVDMTLQNINWLLYAFLFSVGIKTMLSKNIELEIPMCKKYLYSLVIHQ